MNPEKKETTDNRQRTTDLEQGTTGRRDDGTTGQRTTDFSNLPIGARFRIPAGAGHVGQVYYKTSDTSYGREAGKPIWPVHRLGSFTVEPASVPRSAVQLLKSVLPLLVLISVFCFPLSAFSFPPYLQISRPSTNVWQVTVYASPTNTDVLWDVQSSTNLRTWTVMSPTVRGVPMVYYSTNSAMMFFRMRWYGVSIPPTEE